MWPVTQNLIGSCKNLSFKTSWTSQWRREFLLWQKKLIHGNGIFLIYSFLLFSNLLLLCTFYLLSLCLKIYINAKREHLVLVWDLFSYSLLSINQKALVLYFINERKFLVKSSQTQSLCFRMKRKIKWKEIVSFNSLAASF